MKVSSVAEVTDLIKARYPLIYIVSSEESRVTKALAAIAVDMRRPLSEYSITNGTTALVGKAEVTKEADPKLMLRGLGATAQDGIFVLQDFNPYFQDPVIVRGLREAAEAFRTGEAKRSIIMISPTQKLPPELDKLATVIDWDLPTASELGELIKTMVENAGVKFTAAELAEAVNAALGLTEMETENAVSKAMVRTKKLDAKTIQDEKKQVVRKSGLLEFYETTESTATVGGLDNLKQWLRKRRNAFSPKAEAFKLPKPKGMVVVGPPGTGKSLVAKATGNAWNFPLLKLDMGKIFQGLVGSSEENMRKVLKTVEAVAPCILWIDEIEKGMSGGGGGGGDSGTTQRVFASFLTWMQEKTAPVFVVATANGVDNLPPEILRKGRFDEIFFVDLPTEQERAEIFKIHLEKMGRKFNDTGIASLAAATPEYTGAEIEQIIVTAMYDAFDRDEELNAHHCFEAVKNVTPLSKTAAQAIKHVRDWAQGKAQPAATQQTDEPKKSGRRVDLS